MIQAFDHDQNRLKRRISLRQPPSIALKRLTVAWQQMVVAYPATYAVSLAYNNRIGDRVIPIELDRIHKNLDRLHWIVDRNLYGSHVNERPAEERSSFVAFVENIDSNVHVHLAWRVPEDRWHDFPNVVTEKWGSPAYRTSFVEKVYSNGWAEYITKDLWQHALTGDARLFFSSRCQIS